MRPLFIYFAAALLASCDQAPDIKSDHDIAAGCLGWNVDDETPRPSGFSLTSLTQRVHLEDARFVHVENGQCGDVSGAGDIDLSTHDIQQFSIYNLPDGRMGLLLTITNPLGGTSYIGGTF